MAKKIINIGNQNNDGLGDPIRTAFEKTNQNFNEIYDTDEEYAVGTVIIVGGDREVTACTTDSNVSVAGVISEKPGLLMNDKGRGQAIALRGKVPVLIIGAIVRGDLIVTSAERGCGRSAGTAPEFKAVAFAIALESNESDSVKSVMSLIL